MVEAHGSFGLLDMHGPAREDVGEAETRQDLVQDLLEGHALQIDALHAGIQIRIEEDVVVRTFSGGPQEVLQIRIADRHGDPAPLRLGGQPLATAERGSHEEQGHQQVLGVHHGVSAG